MRILALLLMMMASTTRAAQIDIPGPFGSVAFGTYVAVLSNGNIVVVDPDGGPFVDGGVVHLYNSAAQRIKSLNGTAAGDHVGSGGVVLVGSGNFVVLSPEWNSGAGAVTWVNGTTGPSPNYVNASNSLMGTHTNDHVGSSGVTVLSNGNYVVRSPDWNGTLGAATLGRGTTGTTGPVLATNSLVGSKPGDSVGGNVVALSNGNYVVASPLWHGNTGAATWGDGTKGASGEVSEVNSLVGTAADDYVGWVTALSNGDYVVSSFNWNGTLGAATWGNGGTGVTGAVSAGNSLVGSNYGDHVGSNVIALSNGNYVVASPDWNGAVGAATWSDGKQGLTGIVSAGNSLIGTAPNDRVGQRVTALSNGNYVVGSPYWNGNIGMATWADGATGRTGAVSAGNSLIGTAAGDYVGNVATALSNGNYVVGSYNWSGGIGAATWRNGTMPTSGVVSASNSLVGTAPNDYVGLAVIALNNGNYVVASEDWNGTGGAATWGNGATGSSGVVSASNSLVGTAAPNELGYRGATALSNGNYVVTSPYWNYDLGATTWGNGVTGVSGPVSAGNSLVGTAASDLVGYGYVTDLIDGNYVVVSPHWHGAVGAVTLASGAFRLAGGIQPWNSVIGTATGGGPLMVFAYDAARQRLVVGRPADNIVSLFTMDQIFAGSFE